MEAAKNLSDNVVVDEKLAGLAKNLADNLKKSAEKSANKSAEKLPIHEVTFHELSKRQKQILNCMEPEKSYRTEEIAQSLGLKNPRTRQLLNELVAMNLISCTGSTKKRRYIKGRNFEQ